MQWIRPCINECEAFPLTEADQNLRCIKYTQLLEDINNYQLLRKVESEVAALLRNPVFWTTISSYLFSLAKPYSGVILFRRECNFSWLVQLLWRWHSPWKQLRHFVLIATTAWSNLLPATTFASRHNALCVNLTSILVGFISDLFLPIKKYEGEEIWHHITKWETIAVFPLYVRIVLKIQVLSGSCPVSAGAELLTLRASIMPFMFVMKKMPKKPYIRQNLCENLTC